MDLVIWGEIFENETTQKSPAPFGTYNPRFMQYKRG
jgi:hypothetical protein